MKDLVRRIGRGVRPVYDLLFGDPLRQGRLRLDGLPAWVRQAAIVGVLALGALLVSLLAGDLWRRGELFHLTAQEGRLTYVPVALLPVTLLALMVGWTLVLAGAVQAASAARLGIGILFLLINAPMSQVPVVRFAASGFDLAPVLVRVGYFGPPAALAISAAMSLRPELFRRARPLVTVAAVALGAAYFAGLYWSHLLQVQNGVPPSVPFLVSAAMRKVQLLVVPLVVMGGIAIIDFSRDVAAAAVTPLWRGRAGVAKVLVSALIVGKLWIQVGRHAGDWMTRVQARPGILLLSILLLAALGVGARLALGPPRNPDAAADGQERLVHAAGVALAVPALVLLLLGTLGDFLILQAGLIGPARAIGSLPVLRYLSSFDVLAWATLLGLGVVLVRRRRPGTSREVAVGLLLVGAWATAFFALRVAGVEPPVNLALLDILVTVAVAAVLVARWPRIDAAGAARLGVIVLFGWLVLTEGDFLAIVGSLLGLPGIIVVVIGTLFVLAAGSTFASRDTPRFPRVSRPLLWMGYLVVSVAITNWVNATHAGNVAAEAGARAFFYVGIPMAVWLLTRRPVSAPPR